MKKYLFGVMFTVAVIGFALFTAPVHAQTNSEITPQDAAILNQELEAMKATLLNMQQSTGEQRQTVAVVVSTAAALTQAEKSMLQSTLGLLSNVLVLLNDELQNNQVSAERLDAISVSLTNITQSFIGLNESLASSRTQVASQPPAPLTALVQPSPEESAPTEPLSLSEEQLQSALLREESNTEEEIAAAASALSSQRRWTAIGIGVLFVIFGALWYRRMKRNVLSRTTSAGEELKIDEQKLATESNPTDSEMAL